MISSPTSIIPWSTHNSSSLKLISTYDSSSSRHSRAETPVIASDEHGLAIDEEQDIDDLFEKRFKTKHYAGSEKCEKKIDGIEELLKKQSKQIRTLYELQKSTNEKITWIQNQLKQQTNNNNDIDLNSKVFIVNNFIFLFFKILFSLNNYLYFFVTF